MLFKDRKLDVYKYLFSALKMISNPTSGLDTDKVQKV